MTSASEFQRESYRIDEQIWDALALRPGDRILVLGLANDGAWLKRAVEIGAVTTAIAADEASIAKIEDCGATVLRGSATMIPASEGAYDAAIAMHYLHEIDPGFHAQVISEMGRVARRVVIVEPSPPADPLGKRIAALYARARRDEGRFEGYQPIEYWRKLLAIAKADVWQQLITFTRVPPPHAVNETIALMLNALAIEQLPERYLDEVRALAARKDAQLLPMSRIVLVGTASGAAPPKGSPERFRPGVDLAMPPPAARETLAVSPAPPPLPPPHPATPTAPAWTPGGFGFGDDEPVMPPPPTPSRSAHQPAAPQPPAPPRQPVPPAAPFGTPFALPDDDPPFGGAVAPEAPKSGFGWSWEPPDEPEPPEAR